MHAACRTYALCRMLSSAMMMVLVMLQVLSGGSTFYDVRNRAAVFRCFETTETVGGHCPVTSLISACPTASVCVSISVRLIDCRSQDQHLSTQQDAAAAAFRA